MPLILVVEPDRRQAAHLTHVVRQRVGAELILAETTELALASIGNRVPDLILVPALLSPQDDAALAAALRVIATAAHVQMLTTPLFATAAPEPKRGYCRHSDGRSRPKPQSTGATPRSSHSRFPRIWSPQPKNARRPNSPRRPFKSQRRLSKPRSGYAPLEAGRLYRDEAVAHREIRTGRGVRPTGRRIRTGAAH